MNKQTKFSPERLKQIKANITRICINKTITKQFIEAAEKTIVKYKKKDRNNYFNATTCSYCEIAKFKRCNFCIIDKCSQTFELYNRTIIDILVTCYKGIIPEKLIAAAEAERIEFHEAVIELLNEHLKTL